MESIHLVAALLTGLLFVTVSAVCAALYTPYTKSLFDTAFTAFTGSSLQVGNLLVVSALTGIVFKALAAFAGAEFSVLVPVVVGYAAVHVVAHRATRKVGDLMATPLDPDFSLESVTFGPLSLGAAGAALGGRGDGNDRN